MELFLTKKDPTICLNMIVKNESRIIKRLLDNVISIIDTYCICDTGSTDNTIELIKEYFVQKGITGKIIQEPFKNFCYNRNFALNACIGLSDYVLLLDADMVLEINNFNKSILFGAQTFTILQGNEDFYYQNVRIITNNGLYNYVGVTHEYIDLPKNNTILNLDKKLIFIRDIGDGGSKVDKFERDIKLLIEGIKEEPKNDRYYFYLANSYHDIGLFEKAIDIYKRRIEIGGWNEEIWYSYYRIGLCYKNIGKFSDALYYWLEGYEFYPERLEAIYEIIKHYRINGKNKLAMKFYNIAKEILDKNKNKDSYLFLHKYVYSYAIYYEYTIFSAYCGIKNINDEMTQVFNNSNNDDEINNMLSNMKFYKQILTPNIIYKMDNAFDFIINNENYNFRSSSSCLIKKPKKDGYFLNIRYVNYYIEKDGSYKNCEKHIISVNKFVELDNNLCMISEQLMNLLFDNRRYIGIEDIKIYYNKYNDNLIYIGTGYLSNDQIGIVSGDYNINKKSFGINELKQTFNNTNCEKNWVFVDYNNNNHIIYDWHPLKICKLDENNHLNIVDIKNTPKIFSRIRGSSCGFNYVKTIREGTTTEGTTEGMATEGKTTEGITIYKNIENNILLSEIWFINHIVSYENPRHYYHIISVFDSNMNLLRYSAPFKFEGEPIEYCLSIIVEDERVLINYSVWDRTTRIGIYDKKYIESMLKYS